MSCISCRITTTRATWGSINTRSTTTSRAWPWTELLPSSMNGTRGAVQVLEVKVIRLWTIEAPPDFGSLLRIEEE